MSDVDIAGIRPTSDEHGAIGRGCNSGDFGVRGKGIEPVRKLSEPVGAERHVELSCGGEPHCEHGMPAWSRVVRCSHNSVLWISIYHHSSVEGCSSVRKAQRLKGDQTTRSESGGEVPTSVVGGQSTASIGGDHNAIHDGARRQGQATSGNCHDSIRAERRIRSPCGAEAHEAPVRRAHRSITSGIDVEPAPTPTGPHCGDSAGAEGVVQFSSPRGPESMSQC